jgi:mutator protein MutT
MTGRRENGSWGFGGGGELSYPWVMILGMVDVETLRTVLRAAWGPDTCDPHGLAGWRAENPARDQCGPTALVVQDLLGGDLVLGEVWVDGRKVGHHYWNLLPDGVPVDLTSDQFNPEETVVGGEVRVRPPDAPRRCRGQYELLRHRVLAALADAEQPGAAASSVRVAIAIVVVTDPDGAVLLQLRDRDAAAEPGQWGLPGGHLESGETPAMAVVRELAEETGLVADCEPFWHHIRPDLTGSASALEVHAFTARTTKTEIVLGEGQAARFVPVAELPGVDLSPVTAAVLHRLLHAEPPATA